MPARTRKRKVHARERALPTFPEITGSQNKTMIHIIGVTVFLLLLCARDPFATLGECSKNVEFLVVL